MEELYYIKNVRKRHACKSGKILFFNNTAYCFPVIEEVTRPLALNSAKKYGLRIMDAVNPHHTVTFGDCNGTYKVKLCLHGFSVW